ncbi:MAG: DUF3084 domain-containing protein [Xenococcaceae cyanobacterium MO_188.B29]|nr:DUF3084 domain-containing protein [Xenococcaceae cyanobacterium MO_188.B29]
MTSAWILIAAIVLLGGLIAVLGDRLGTKVGKARLRLFKLRPRQTARIITFITGLSIAASTLGILFGLSESLRKGVFQLDDILKEKRRVEGELQQANQEKQEVETQLSTVREQQIEAEKQLGKINQDFIQAQTQLKTVSDQASLMRAELNELLAERNKGLEQLAQLEEQSQQLQSQLQEKEAKIASQDRILQEKETRLQQLEQQKQSLQIEISTRDQQILTLDSAIATKDQELQTRKEQLNKSAEQLQFLLQRIKTLEKYYQTYIQELRERQIAVVKGQVLASAQVRIVEPSAAIVAIDQVLREANRNAAKAIYLDEEHFDQRVIKITKAQVNQVLKQIQDGQDYVMRIVSAGNYVQGENTIGVFVDLALNKKIFDSGEELATVSIDSEQTTREDIQERFNWLLAASQFRARRAGIIGEMEVGDGQITTLVKFIDQIVESPESLDEIKVIVTETTYTSGPLKVDIVVLNDGEIKISL